MDGWYRLTHHILVNEETREAVVVYRAFEDRERFIETAEELGYKIIAVFNISVDDELESLCRNYGEYFPEWC